MLKLEIPQCIFKDKIEEAKELQKDLAKKVIVKDDFPHPVKTIGGMDISCTPFDPKQMVFGALTLHYFPSLSLIETFTCADQQKMPYIRGLLAFREVPILSQVFSQASLLPDIIMIDGHGVAHPRGLGIASHFGVLLDIPTIGVAKSILIGSPKTALADEVGSTTPLVWKGKEIAMMIRTKKRCNPLIVSSGHRISLETATEIVLCSIKKHRLPEPTRTAHLAANKFRKEYLAKDKDALSFPML